MAHARLPTRQMLLTRAELKPVHVARGRRLQKTLHFEVTDGPHPIWVLSIMSRCFYLEARLR